MLAILLLDDDHGTARETAAQTSKARSVLVLLEDLTPPEPAPRPLRAQYPRRANKQAASLATRAVPPDKAATPAAAASQRDWYGALDTLAQVPKPGRLPRDFSRQPSSPYTPCKPTERPFEWHAEPRQAGFAGVLPYVRVGRCVVGLGFFGCTLHAPPAANSQLLEGIKDAPAAPSSVPASPQPCEPLASSQR